MKRTVQFEISMGAPAAAHVETCRVDGCADCAGLITAAIDSAGLVILGRRAGALKIVDCEWCGDPFTRARSTARYCCPACKQAAYRNRQLSDCLQIGTGGSHCDGFHDVEGHRCCWCDEPSADEIEKFHRGLVEEESRLIEERTSKIL